MVHNTRHLEMAEFQTKGKLFSINTHMIPSKLIYLLSLGCSGSYVPYLNILFRSIGLSTTQAGFISGIRFLSAPVSTTLFGTLTDSCTKYKRLIFLVLCVGAYFPIFSIPWVAATLAPETRHNSTINTTSTIQNNTYEPINLNEASDCLFYTILTVMIFAGFFSVPLSGFIDSAVMNVIKTAKTKTNYGAQRVVGSISFGVANFIAGLAAEHYNHPTLTKYTAIFYVFLPQVIFVFPVGYILLGQCKWGTSMEEESKSSCAHVWRDVLSFFTKFEAIIFICTVLVSGIAYNTFYGFLFLFMRDDLNASANTMTLVIMTTSIAEIIAFPFTSKIIRFIGSAHLTIIIGVFSYFIRFVVMSYTTNPWMIIPIQVIHGIGFSLSWTAQVEYTHTITPKRIAVTTFSIITSLHFAVGAIIANVLGGELYDIIGGKILFRACGIICAAWSFIALLYYLYKNFKLKDNGCGFEKRLYVHEIETTTPERNGGRKQVTSILLEKKRKKPSCIYAKETYEMSDV